AYGIEVASRAAALAARFSKRLRPHHDCTLLAVYGYGLLCRLFSLRRQFLGMPLNQSISSVPATGKNFRQRQHILVLVEHKMGTSLSCVGLSGLSFHHNRMLT